ncbi:alkane hydroxylase MAH1 [Lactuca sativa]|uniref:alkane hydroxylase MAH1 n=1 Tax=Lactuca sativa TaxID=4236 RepID=UPI000CB49102|nr:alkane hydroxylase MAH1 [Lactuca sativa]
MVFLEYLIIIIFLSFLVFHYQPQKLKTLKDRNWLPLGLFSEILTNLHRLHDVLAIYLNRSGGTFMLKGPWFANMDMLLTTDPLDIHHVLSKNFPNYPKGQNYRKLFDIFGDGIVNIDGHLWEIHRKTIKSLFTQPNFQSVLEAVVWKKVESGLLPVLESISKTGMEIDLQDVFQRFTFDTICKVLLEYDPQSLSPNFPYIRCEKAWVDITEGMLYRHLLPPIFWKLQRLLKMGNEKKLSEAYNAVDHFVDKCLARIQHESSNMESEHVHESFGLVTSLVTEFKSQSGNFGYPPKNFVRDTIVTLMGAGRDTTTTTLSWFFYLVAKNPVVEEKIREEIQTFLEMKVDDQKNWNSKEVGKLVYLHGALCEALRLYPAIPFNHKIPLQPEILPSGHQVSQNTRIILYYYGMGRMEKIWGKDCMEFKPERWISEKGGIKHEPSNKFVAFSGGPRTCLGKDMSFTQLKIVASTIIYHYHIELVEGHPVIPSASMVLMMKHGLKVRLTKISEENI